MRFQLGSYEFLNMQQTVTSGAVCCLVVANIEW